MKIIFTVFLAILAVSFAVTAPTLESTKFSGDYYAYENTPFALDSITVMKDNIVFTKNGDYSIYFCEKAICKLLVALDTTVTIDSMIINGDLLYVVSHAGTTLYVQTIKTDSRPDSRMRSLAVAPEAITVSKVVTDGIAAWTNKSYDIQLITDDLMFIVTGVNGGKAVVQYWIIEGDKTIATLVADNLYLESDDVTSGNVVLGDWTGVVGAPYKDGAVLKIKTQLKKDVADKPAVLEALKTISLTGASADAKYWIDAKNSRVWTYESTDSATRKICKFDIDFTKTEIAGTCKDKILEDLKGFCAMGGGFVACKTLLDDTCAAITCKYKLATLYKLKSDVTLEKVASGNNLTGETTDKVFVDFENTQYTSAIEDATLAKMGDGVVVNHILKDTAEFYWMMQKDGAFTNVVSAIVALAAAVLAFVF
eukprot:TRINITY_DN5408_c0_g1_i1.p1 TRINITY_DN5408_c0_g1~~TRINITY_DN5408_c0_g1_i1.p1  ORF type:complete len:424 (+),score=178.17 TRINITY_DN5408_c0_g1_i1:83-1354(+)